MAGLPGAIKYFACSLCSKVVTGPKLLPCMDCFCKTCLKDYICSCEIYKCQSVVYFKCPLCHARVFPYDPQEKKGDWVKTFPICGTIQSFLDRNSKQMSKLRQTQIIESVCTFCSENGDSRKARDFCIECSTVLCESCLSNHRKFRVTRSHKVIRVNDDKEHFIAKSIPAYCDTHTGRELDMKCFDHFVFICSECAIFKQRRCKRVEHIDELVKDTESLNVEMLTDLKGLEEKLEDSLASKIIKTKKIGYMTKSVCVETGLADAFKTIKQRLKADVLESLRAKSEYDKSKVCKSVSDYFRLNEELRKLKDLADTVHEKSSYKHFMILSNVLGDKETEINRFLAQQQTTKENTVVSLIDDKIDALKASLNVMVYMNIDRMNR